MLGVERLDGEPGLERLLWWVLLPWFCVVVEFGELRLDVGQVPLGVVEGLGVAEWLADALAGVGDGLLRGGEVFARAGEQGGDAGDAVLDALDEPDLAVEQSVAVDS